MSRSNKRWTEVEKKILIENYALTTKEVIMELLPNRTWTAIKIYANSTLNIKRLNKRYWTKKEDNILFNCYPKENKENIIFMLKNRTWISIITRARKLKIKRLERTVSKERDKTKKKKPIKEILKTLLFIEEKSFTEIGKIFTVSKGTVKRWCVSYKLPANRQALFSARFENKIAKINPTITLLSAYIKSAEKVKIKCNICDYVWSALPYSLLKGHGCPRCAGCVSMNTKMFVDKLKSVRGKDIILKESFVNMSTHITVQCYVCEHIWKVLPSNLIYQKTQCPMCYRMDRYGYNDYTLILQKEKTKTHTVLFHKREALFSLLEDSLEAFYWAGFIGADGCIHDGKKLTITLARKDEEHLKKFASFIDWKTTLSKNDQIVLGIQDSCIIPKFAEKFGFESRKTYNPPDLTWLENNYFIVFFAGFIDGDGGIRQLKNRPDHNLTIKIHKSWLANLIFFEDTIYNVLNVSKKTLRYKNARRLSKINNQGYAQVTFSNNALLSKFKEKILALNLPVLQRKWSMIRTGIVDNFAELEERERKISNFLLEGMSISTIAKKLNKKKGTIYVFAQRRGLLKDKRSII